MFVGLAMSQEEEIRKELSSLFNGMMKTLHSLEDSQLRIEILVEPKIQKFIETHTKILDSSFQQVEMSEAMRRRLHRSDYLFSGIKTFHELNQAFPSLLDENGNRKPFEQFLNDVRKIDGTYNSHYLWAEYNFAQSSATMAAKWEQFAADGDRYNLQYRTVHDDRVRPEHQALHGVTLPITDPFWEEYFPPNGWNCRCTVVQVRKSKYPVTPHDEAMALGEEATGKDTRGIFRFNPGKEEKTFPDYSPYTIRRCNDCDIAKGKLELARQFVDENQLCQACRFLREKTNQESTRRLNKQERKDIKDAALAWADKHLPRIEMPDGSLGARLTVSTVEGYELHIGKTFFSETYSKNKNSRKIAETMETAACINEWIVNARHVRVEDGRHHSFRFEVFRAEFHGQEIEFKAKMTEGLIVYTMRLI